MIRQAFTVKRQSNSLIPWTAQSTVTMISISHLTKQTAIQSVNMRLQSVQLMITMTLLQLAAPTPSRKRLITQMALLLQMLLTPMMAQLKTQQLRMTYQQVSLLPMRVIIKLTPVAILSQRSLAAMPTIMKQSPIRPPR